MLSARGIVSGFAGDYFRPDRPVTRGICRTVRCLKVWSEYNRFNDIPSNFWAVKAIDRATQAGF